MRKGTHVRPHRRSNRTKSWKAGRGLYGNYKVGKNQIFKDPLGEQLWVIEVFEYYNDNLKQIPMFSTFDAVKSREQAVALAKLVRSNNMSYYWDKLRENPNYPLKSKPLLHPHLSKTKDSDHDGIPDAYDCQPHNPKKQDYASLNEQLQGRNKSRRKIDNNTYAERRDGNIAVKLHNTDVVTFKTNGNIVLDSGGWKTPTTKDRINNQLPHNVRIIQEKGVWYVVLVHPNTQDFNPWDKAEPRYLFVDGMEINPLDGTVLGSELMSKFTRKKSSKLKTQINKYAKDYVDALYAGKVPKPSVGDCWFCTLKTTEGVTLGDKTKDTEHLLSHFQEKYYVPALLWNAIKEYPVSQAGMWSLQSIWEDKKTEEIFSMKDQFVSSLKRYLNKRMGFAS